jgi:Zinc finger, C4 type (two domains)
VNQSVNRCNAEKIYLVLMIRVTCINKFLCINQIVADVDLNRSPLVLASSSSSTDLMEVKPDISGLRLRHGAIAGQSPDGAANAIGGTHQGAQIGNDLVDYGVASSGEPLYVSAALPTNEDGIYLVTSCNNAPGSGASATSTDKKHMCAICGDRASGKHYGVHR